MNRRAFFSSCFQAASAAGLAAQVSASANERIERAPQAALDALKPSPKALQHGLELHAASLVMDAYGFSPRAAVDGNALCAAIEAGASEVELEDA